MEYVNVGIAGCGAIAMTRHLPSLKKNNAVVVALFDINKANAEKAKEEFGTENTIIYESYDEFLKNSLMQAVFVLTPNYLHCEYSVKAMAAGKDVMCEKPMAISYDEALQMIKAKNQYNRVLSIAYQLRYTKDISYLKKEIMQGELGEIYFAKAIALRRRLVPTWGSFFNKEIQGGGALIDIGTHSLDLVLYLTDNYKPAYCIGKTYQGFKGKTDIGNEWGDYNDRECQVEDAAFAMVVMENGMTIMIESSWALNVKDSGEGQVLLAGTKAGADNIGGKLTINGVKNNTQYILTPQTEKTNTPPLEKDKTPEDIENEIFLNAVLRKGEVCVTAEQGAAVTRILEGIYISAQTGQPYNFK